jgi:hypothetical protein
MARHVVEAGFLAALIVTEACTSRFRGLVTGEPAVSAAGRGTGAGAVVMRPVTRSGRRFHMLLTHADLCRELPNNFGA